MLTANVLNPNATLNSFTAISAMDFFPGSNLTLIMQLFDDAENNRYIPPSTAVLTVIFNNSDGTTLSVVASLNTSDRSLATVSLTGTQTSNIFGGSVQLSLDLLGDGTQIVQGVVYNALTKQTLDS